MEKGEEYTQITNMLCRGDIADAAEAIEKAKSTLPVPVYLECLGNIHFYKRELQEAVNKYEQAMFADANYDVARYHYIVGTRKERGGHYGEAFKRYQVAIEIEPTFVDSYIELGGLCVKIGEFESALTCYTDALRLDPNDLRNFSNRASVLAALARTDPDQYAEEYQRAARELENAATRLPPIDETARW